MKKNDLIKDMQAFTGAGFITRKRFADYMGKKDARDVDKYLNGLDRIGKDYFIPDVAERLLLTRSVR